MVKIVWVIFLVVSGFIYSIFLGMLRCIPFEVCDKIIFSSIFSVSLLWNVYLYKYLELWGLNYKNHDAEMYHNKAMIPYIKYNNFKVLSKLANSISTDAWLLGVLVITGIASFISSIIYYDGLYTLCAIVSAFLGCLGLVFHGKDVKNFCEITKKSKSHLYAEFKDESVDFNGCTQINRKYNYILFYREIYKEMSVDNIKNELILIEQQIDDRGKLNFVHICLIPGILAIVGGIFSVISTMLAYHLDKSEYTAGVVVAYITIIIGFIIAIFAVFFLINNVFMSEKKNLLMQKTIIEECIEKKNENTIILS